MEEIRVSIRNIQHYLYCPHRWGLINIDCSWVENYFVTKGNIIHNRVHDPENSYISRNKRVLTSVPVFHDEMGIYGVVDCIELTKSAKGVQVGDLPGTYHISIVEYKPRKPRDKDFNEDDAIQVFAQKICVDSIFHCDSEGIIYYSDVKKRIRLPFREHYQDYLTRIRQLLTEIREYTMKGEVPPVRKNQKCGGCSFQDMCMPKVLVTKKGSHFQDMVEED